MARQLGRVAWCGDDFAYCCSELCSEGQQPVQVLSTDAMRRVIAEAPGDRIHAGVLGQWGLLSEPDKRRLDQTRGFEDPRGISVMILNLTRPDVRDLRNLKTGKFSPVQTSKSDDLKTVSLYR
ncbi:hypothetical protein Bbelb_392590 [Branchiostoma belcheri]|nr:hypothetical protein Bbelb_392590 [Branchiostoma belcheri]